MKLRLNRQEMVEALSAICTVAAARTPKETLRCVHIEAQTDAVFLSATDLELSLRYAVTQVEVEESGTILVVAETFARIARECTDEVLEIDLAENVLHIRGAGSHFQIVTHDPADFPAVPLAEGDPDTNVEYGLLRRLVEWTVFAAARESTRYAINGVLWEVKDGKLTMAATDGRRLSVAHGKLASGAPDNLPQVIVPGKSLSLLGRLPAEADALVGLKMLDNQLLMKVGGVVVSTSLVEGHFPEYKDVIPADCDRLVRLNTAEFQSALKRASLLTNEESKGVRFSFSQGNLILSSRAPEQGEAEISLPVEYDDEPMEIGFNPLFLLEALRITHEDEITLALKDSSRPGVIRLGDDFIYVVMPINLSSG